MTEFQELLTPEKDKNLARILIGEICAGDCEENSGCLDKICTKRNLFGVIKDSEKEYKQRGYNIVGHEQMEGKLYLVTIDGDFHG